MLKGRKVAILIADGSDGKALAGLKAAVEKAGGACFVVAPKVGAVRTTTGPVAADGQLAGSPSVLFDAVALILDAAQADALTREAAAVQFVMDAFGHLKAIGHVGADPLLKRAGVEPDEGVTGLGKPFLAAAAQRFYDREPKVRTLP